MATYDLVNIGSGNGLLTDGTKPLPEPIMSKVLLHSITPEEFQCSWAYIHNMFSQITPLEWLPITHRTTELSSKGIISRGLFY